MMMMTNDAINATDWLVSNWIAFVMVKRVDATMDA